MTFCLICIIIKQMKQAMKRDSKQEEDFREKPFGVRLYLRIAEPVLELCTDR